VSTPAALKVKQIAVDELHNAPWNANRVPDDVLDKVRRSIAEFGVVENLVARPRPEGGYEVISGNHRLGIYREMGLTRAPVHVLEVDDAHARVLAQTLNRTRGQDDAEAYAQLLTDVLAEMDMDEVLSFLPESEKTISQALDALSEPADDAVDEVPELPEEPDSKAGEVYELGPHRLVCGDSTDPGTLFLLMQGDKASCMWTDPPYGVDYVGKTKDALTIENDGGEGLPALLASSFAAVDQVLEPGAAVYVAHPAGARAHDFSTAFIGAGWRIHQGLVWAKDSMVLGHSDYHYSHEPILYGYTAGGGRRGRGGLGWYGDNKQVSVLDIPRPKRNEEHPTMKPPALIELCLRNSTKRDDIVLDPFGGSGSTLIAADRLGRRARLVELDPRYCDVIRQRWEKHNG
jgi:DNA modification methylase